MIAAVVVYYNPEESIYKKIKDVVNIVDKVYIIDNSSIDNSSLTDNSCNKIKYIPLMKNKGIAYALKLGADLAINDKYDYLLTLDQDSVMTGECLSKLLSYVNKNDMSDVAIVAPEFNNASTGIECVDMVITSGNIINLSLYKKINRFNENLFIDFVDFDLCYQFREKNYKIILMKEALLIHSLGENNKHRIFGKEFNNTNHSPLRKYYLYRNEYFCTHISKERKKFFKKIHTRLYTIDLLKIILLEDKKIKKFKMIKKGIKDAKNHKLGGI